MHTIRTDHGLAQRNPQNPAKHACGPIRPSTKNRDLRRVQTGLHQAVPDGAHLPRVNANHVPHPDVCDCKRKVSVSANSHPSWILISHLLRP